jgi:hypothetical protein
MAKLLVSASQTILNPSTSSSAVSKIVLLFFIHDLNFSSFKSKNCIILAWKASDRQGGFVQQWV